MDARERSGARHKGNMITYHLRYSRDSQQIPDVMTCEIRTIHQLQNTVDWQHHCLAHARGRLQKLEARNRTLAVIALVSGFLLFFVGGAVGWWWRS